MRYRAAPAATIKAVPLDALTAVFHRPSGQTHLLIEPAPQILAALGDTAATPAELVDRLAERFDLGRPDHAALAARLDELVAIGLVMSV